MRVGAERLRGRTPDGRERARVELDVAPEGTPVPKGAEVVHVCALPACGRGAERSRRVSRRASRTRGFVFDGRTYSGEEDASCSPTRRARGRRSSSELSAATVREAGAAADLLPRRAAGDYVVVIGDVRLGLPEDRTVHGLSGALAIDRASDRDEIAERDAFYKSLVREKKGVVTWECAHRRARRACEKWQPVAAKLAGKKPFAVRVFPDARDEGALGRLLAARGPRRRRDGRRARRPRRLGAGGAGPDRRRRSRRRRSRRRDPRSPRRPILLCALGARRGRHVVGARREGLRGVRARGGRRALARGRPRRRRRRVARPRRRRGASWLDAGARLDGEAAVDKALGGPDPALVDRARALARGLVAAGRRSPRPAGRCRTASSRGVSYAMTNSIEAATCRRRSPKTLARLRGARRDVRLGHALRVRAERSTRRRSLRPRDPRGETDEAILRAVADARALGMTAMVKPQVWVGDGVRRKDRDARRGGLVAGVVRRLPPLHRPPGRRRRGGGRRDLLRRHGARRRPKAHEKEWRAVIAAVRLATGAPLVYAANWAARVARRHVLGRARRDRRRLLRPARQGQRKAERRRARGRASAAPRGRSPRRSRQVLEPARHLHRGRLSPRPRRVAGAARRGLRVAHAPEDAARCVAAVYRALGREAWWKGVYWWKAFSDGGAAPAGREGLQRPRDAGREGDRGGLRQHAGSGAANEPPAGDRSSRPPSRPPGPAGRSCSPTGATSRTARSRRRQQERLRDARRPRERGAHRRDDPRALPGRRLPRRGGRVAARRRRRRADVDHRPARRHLELRRGLSVLVRLDRRAAKRGELVAGGHLGSAARRALHGRARRRGVPQRRCGSRSRRARASRARSSRRDFRSATGTASTRTSRSSGPSSSRRAPSAAPGSAALDLACVAAGVFDGFFEFRLSPWDIAAGAILIEEAGGEITDFDGGERYLERGNIVAGSRGRRRGDPPRRARHRDGGLDLGSTAPSGASIPRGSSGTPGRTPRGGSPRSSRAPGS